MNENFENELRRALRPVDAPDGFTERLMRALPAQRPPARYPRWYPSRKYRSSRRAVLDAGALAASLLVAVLAGQQVAQVRAERQAAGRGLAASRELMQALRVTSEKLDIAYQAVQAAPEGAEQRGESLMNARIASCFTAVVPSPVAREPGSRRPRDCCACPSSPRSPTRPANPSTSRSTRNLLGPGLPLSRRRGSRTRPPRRRSAPGSPASTCAATRSTRTSPIPRPTSTACAASSQAPGWSRIVEAKQPEGTDRRRRVRAHRQRQGEGPRDHRE